MPGAGEEHRQAWFDGDGVSVWEDEKVVETGGGDGECINTIELYIK